LSWYFCGLFASSSVNGSHVENISLPLSPAHISRYDIFSSLLSFLQRSREQHNISLKFRPLFREIADFPIHDWSRYSWFPCWKTSLFLCSRTISVDMILFMLPEKFRGSI
jgi:hypothetical protein